MWIPIGISLHKRPSDWKLAQEVDGSGPMKGKTNPGRAAANRLAVGPLSNNWKGGHASGDNRRAYLNMKAREYRADRRYHAD